MSDCSLSCPACGSRSVVKNGTIHNKKQKYKCKECNRQFVKDPTKKLIDEQTKKLIDKLL